MFNNRNSGGNYTPRNLWFDYKSEVLFGLLLLTATILSYWLGTFIPEQVFETYINPIDYISTFTVCFFGAAILFAHKEQNTIRRSWAIVLLVWGVIDVSLCLLRYILQIKAIGGTAADPLYNASLTVGNILAWLLFIYPSQVLRPGWLNWWRATILVLPMIIVGVVDYFVPQNLLQGIMIYPAVIFIMLCRHVSKYRQRCEDNYSSMDDIDVQWIVRYLTMLLIAGCSFYFISFCYLPNRMFTQNWVLLLILAYTTIRVIYRPDPWSQVQNDEEQNRKSENDEAGYPKEIDDSYRVALEAWVEQEKPYLNPDFQLSDLWIILPMNRTYLSQFINATYGVSFFQWANGMRIEEAKHLMQEHPEMKIQEIAVRSGFASRHAFTRTFTRETGMAPREWCEKG